MKILVPLHGFIDWNGGLDLIRLLNAVLNEAAVTNNIEIVYAVPKRGLVARILHTFFRAIQLRRANIKSNSGNSQMLSLIAMEIVGTNTSYFCGTQGKDIAKLANNLNIDIIFPCLVPIQKTSAIKIGYIFDFQHMHLPYLFSSRIIRKRNRRFGAIANASDALIVNSDFVRDDVIKFLKYTPRNIFKLPFIPFKNLKVTVDIPVTLDKYGIKKPYLIVCNHFWMHKDHTTALQAFSLLHANPAYSDMLLILTGDPVDHRNPAHYNELLMLTKSLGIDNHTRFLGLIPKSDQLSLLCAARLLIQPTRYEGGPGGGAVYEALGNSVPTVLSNIKVNKEIHSTLVYFFVAGDANSLATTIERVLATESLNTTVISENSSLQHAARDLHKFMCELLINRQLPQ